MSANKLLSSLAFAVAATVGANALAAQPDWYVGGDVGWNNAENVDLTFTSGPHPVPFDDGWIGTLKAGARFGAVRAEVEYAHRSNDAEFFGPPGSIDNARGSIDSDALMLNGYFDFKPQGKITPYVGAGVGAIQVEADNIRKDITFCCSGIVDDDDTAFAIQLMAGAAFAVTSSLDVTVEYRYLLADASFDYAIGCDVDDTIGSCGVEGKASDDYKNQSLLLGLRYRF
jgi:opacity protein-like surface antigen